MTHSPTKLADLIEEIKKRENALGRKLDEWQVRQTLRHLSDLMAEEWRTKISLEVSQALRKKGLRRLKAKNNIKT